MTPGCATGASGLERYAQCADHVSAARIRIESVKTERRRAEDDLGEQPALEVAVGVDGACALSHQAEAQPLDGLPSQLAPRVVVAVIVMSRVSDVFRLDVEIDRTVGHACL